MKWNILRRLSAHGCDVRVYPAATPAATVLATAPDGVFLSNGPGDPAVLTYAIDSAKALVEAGVPTFGICLGHQILGLAMGGSTFKLKFGHRGANHPVKKLDTGKIEITSQNHGFAVDPGSLPPDVAVTHVNLYDGTVEGLRHRTRPVFSVQYHPEASPGPHDADYLFDDFITLIEQRRAAHQLARRCQNAPISSASSSSARDRSSSARPANSTIPARRPARRCARKVSRSCSSTATRRRS